MADILIKDIVKERYAAAALRATTGGSACCGGASAIAGAKDPITSNLYGADQTLGLPAAAVSASLGCGNPTALAGGIAEALICTAAGLAVAIPATICYRLLRGRVERLVVAMEKEAMKLVQAIEQQPGVRSQGLHAGSQAGSRGAAA